MFLFQSNNMVIQTAVKYFLNQQKEHNFDQHSLPHIITSNLEHDSISITLSQLKQENVIGK